MLFFAFNNLDLLEILIWNCVRTAVSNIGPGGPKQQSMYS